MRCERCKKDIEGKSYQLGWYLLCYDCLKIGKLILEKFVHNENLANLARAINLVEHYEKIKQVKEEEK